MRSLALPAFILVGLSLILPDSAAAQNRVIDSWSGIVLNCRPTDSVRWAGEACKRLIGEMQQRADEAKVRFVALPEPADDKTLDRRAFEQGIPPLMNHMHIRFEVSGPTPGARDQSATVRLVLRSMVMGPLASIRKDGDYPVLIYAPQIILQNGSDHAAALNQMPVLADAFFMPMLKARP